MTPEQIIEIARRYGSFYDPDDEFTFGQEDLIAFAQAIIEERESIGEPVAWIDHEGGLYHYKLYETYLPLYRHPRPKSRLTDEEIDDVISKQRFLYGADANAYTFARAIERKIWEECIK